MITLSMFVPIAFFTFFLLISLKGITITFVSIDFSVKIIAVSWILLLAGLGVWFQRTNLATGLDSADTSAFIQVASIIYISLVVFIFHFSLKFELTMPTFLKLFLLYAIIGMLTTIVSTNPAVTFFKSYSLAVVILFVAISLTVLEKKTYSNVFLDMTYIYFILLIFLSLVGGILYPDMTHRINKGVLGFMLTGWPALNSNTLSFLAGIVTAIALTKSISSNVFRLKGLHISILSMSTVSLFFAQGRTSIGSLFFGLLILIFIFGEFQKLKYVLIISTLIIIVYSSTGIFDIDSFDEISKYLKRGSNNEQIASLSGRTDLWARAIEKISLSPWLGHGFYVTTVYGPYGPHNSFLQVLLYSGFLGFLVWILAILSGFNKIFWGIKNIRFYKYINKEDYFILLQVLLITVMAVARIITGSDLTVHHYSTLLFLGVYVYIYLLANNSQEIRTHIINPKKTFY